MIEFKPVTKADIPQIREYSSKCATRSCDHCVGGIYLWGEFYHYEIAESHESLLIKGQDEDGNTAFSCPLSDHEGKIKQAVEEIKQYCLQNGIVPRLSFVPESLISCFEGCKITKLEGWSDYIYDASELAELPGKKFHKKKNRKNKFQNDNADYEYKRITIEMIPQISEFFERYVTEYGLDDKHFEAETKLIRRTLDEYDALFYVGGALFVSGRCVAFTLGEIIGDTLITHTEKALREFDGAYEAINSFFAEDCLQYGIKYINREEDIGIEGLRTAKLSYNPVFLIDKYEITL